MKLIRNSLSLVIISMVLCGFIFPMVVLGLGQLCFHDQANGSLVKADGKVVGSKLIGQQWRGDRYFHGRESSVKYNMDPKLVQENGIASGSDNFSNDNPQLKQRVEKAIEKDGKDQTMDAVTASGSGLDPDITVTNARYQIKRVSKARHLKQGELKNLIDKHTHQGAYTGDYVNVLELNMALDHK